MHAFHVFVSCFFIGVVLFVTGLNLKHLNFTAPVVQGYPIDMEDVFTAKSNLTKRSHTHPYLEKKATNTSLFSLPMSFWWPLFRAKYFSR